MADDLEDVPEDLRRIVRGLAEVAADILEEAGTEIGSIAVSEYMRDAGAAAATGGETLGPNNTDTLRIVSGTLARSMTGARTDRAAPDSIQRIEQVSTGVVQLIKGSKVEYAGVPEKGFRGTVQVPQHTRTQTQAFGQPIDPVQVQVSAHRRRMDIPARPYLGPAIKDYLPELREMGKRKLRDFVKRILQS